MNDDRKLPPGWIKEHDPASNHPFWVDTKANPPRSIWTHPLDDPQFIAEHPEYQKVDEKNSGKEKYNPPTSPRPVSWDERAGQASSSRKRGFFGKMKDKAIGTKEEREAEKRRQEQLREQQRQAMLQRQQEYQRQQQMYYQQNPGYANPSGFNAPVYAPPRRGGGGFGGAGLPLLGGLAGGLLLGSAIDGFDGGDYGGGDFGGGDFGGGDFGGGF